MPVQIKGVGSISGLDQGIVVGIVTSTTQINVGSNIKFGSAGIASASNFKTGSSNLHSTGLTVGNNFLHSTGINVGTGATIHVPATNVLTFGTNSNERLRIDSTGWMGAGQTSSDNAGQVAAFKNTSSTHSWLSVNVNNNTGIGGIVFGDSDSWSPAFIQVNHSSNIMQFYNGGSERVRILSDGKFGIGDFTSGTAVSQALHVKGSQPEIYLEHTGGQDMTLTTNDGMGQNGITVNGGFLSLAYNNKNIVMCRTGGNVGINETSPDSLLHLTTNSSTSYSYSTVNTVNSTNALLRLENTNGSDGSGVDNYVGVYFRVANGANSDAQLQYVREGDNKGAFHFKARNTGTSYPNLMTMKSDGNIGVGVTNPKSKLHLGSTGDVRFGSQYGGFAHINQQVQYSAGYSGVHWMFESNNMISWCFDGVLIVYGGGGSSYGSEVTKITIVYSRENGANNSGDIWRNGTTSYNVETLGHAQVGLSPGSGELTVAEDTAPDGAASQRSLFKLGWSSASTGGSTTTWSKLHGTLYWGQGVGYGSVEVQDKDGNIFWNSNP